jgi:endonuclease YncB( thermonuclease family)
MCVQACLGCHSVFHYVWQVVDGDTIIIGSRHIRLFGIDAFERDQMCGRFACGAQATRVMRELVRGQIVTCEKQDVDSYGRIVAICHSATGLDLGSVMVRRGLAVDYRHFTDRYMADEIAAKQARAGAWAYGFDSPLTYRRRHRLD